MKRILLIQCRMDARVLREEAQCYVRAAEGIAHIELMNALDAHPWQEPQSLFLGYDGVMIGGSGEFYLDGGFAPSEEARARAEEILKRLRFPIAYALEKETPLLGVCFGHQLMAIVQGATVKRDTTQEKFGSHMVTLSAAAADDPLFAGFPRSFLAQYGHKDSVISLPSGATILGAGEHCAFAALRFGKRAYGVQFHAELSAEDMAERLLRYSGYLPEGVDARSVVQPSPEADRIIPNFLERVAGAK